MSVLIKGMEMPKSCWVCNFCRHFDEPNQGFFCLILEEKVDYESSSLYTKGNCPLVPVPPHGRLIDADALLSLLDKCMFPSDMVTTSAVRMATNWIKDAPTIIESEEEDG